MLKLLISHINQIIIVIAIFIGTIAQNIILHKSTLNYIPAAREVGRGSRQGEGWGWGGGGVGVG